MSSVAPVPEAATTSVVPLGAREAWTAARRTGLWPVAGGAFHRFRYGDGFSHARALGLQLSLATIPLVIAAVGLAASLRSDVAGLLLRRTLMQLTPGASDQLVRSTLTPFREDTAVNEVALVAGLVLAAVASATGMGQLERGANRIYGIQRDRPAAHKYLRALVLAALAGFPAAAGLVLLVTAGAFSAAVESVYGLDEDVVKFVTWPTGTFLALVSITVMLHASPARSQPSWSLLATVGLITVGLWIGLTALLAGFLALSAGITSIYGPLTGIMALLVWAQLTAGALFLAVALAAELEAGVAAAGPGRTARPDSSRTPGDLGSSAKGVHA